MEVIFNILLAFSVIPITVVGYCVLDYGIDKFYRKCVEHDWISEGMADWKCSKCNKFM